MEELAVKYDLKGEKKEYLHKLGSLSYVEINMQHHYQIRMEDEREELGDILEEEEEKYVHKLNRL